VSAPFPLATVPMSEASATTGVAITVAPEHFVLCIRSGGWVTHCKLFAWASKGGGKRRGSIITGI
jgi:hypothetical protein